MMSVTTVSSKAKARNSTSPVAIATLSGRAYYRITSLLKEVGIPFGSLIPGGEVPKGVKVVLTTLSERKTIQSPSVIALEEFSDPSSLRHEIAKRLQSQGNGKLIVGIDPGSRIGVVAFYGDDEIYSNVLSSADQVVSRVCKLQELTKNSDGENIIRVGNGDLRLAVAIVKGLKGTVGQAARIELVDERGTSSNINAKPNRRGVRDLRAAAIIAFREGSRIS